MIVNIQNQKEKEEFCLFYIALKLNLYSASDEGQHFEASSFIQCVFSELLLSARSTWDAVP